MSHFPLNSSCATNTILAEYVVFITPTEIQLSMFSKMLSAEKLDDVMGGTTAESLALINHLTKISSSPILLKATVEKSKVSSGGSPKNKSIEEAAKLIPADVQPHDVSLSGPFWLLPCV
jgi:DNA repair and recombination protein RAD54B